MLWFVESDIAESALAGKLIEEQEVETRPERVSPSCLDENVCLRSIQKYFTHEGWRLKRGVSVTTRLLSGNETMIVNYRLTWLDCHSEFDHGKKVTKLSCSVFAKYQDKIKGRKNFSDKWITGAESLRTLNIIDHAQCKQHKHTMTLRRKEQAQSKGLGAASYARIA